MSLCGNKKQVQNWKFTILTSFLYILGKNCSVIYFFLTIITQLQNSALKEINFQNTSIKNAKISWQANIPTYIHLYSLFKDTIWTEFNTVWYIFSISYKGLPLQKLQDIHVRDYVWLSAQKSKKIYIWSTNLQHAQYDHIFSKVFNKC